jgi:hypothetical protein
VGHVADGCSDRRVQDVIALQAYFEQIGNLITEHGLMQKESSHDPIQLVANAQTLKNLIRSGKVDPDLI